ncbi:MAG: methyltransferase domain-containing protein [archaeon]|jgi:ubiquinone/menaquinone biosynthesis C-methylase UbiE
MIPRKTTLLQKIRTKKFLQTLPPRINIPKRMLSKAAQNAVARASQSKNQQAYERHELALRLATSRTHDRKLSYGVSYHANLAATNQALGIKLQNMIREMGSSGGSVLEIGCGSGKTVSQLKGLFPKTAFSATGTALEKKWMNHRNFRNIDWHVAHLNQLEKVFRGRKFNLIYSSLGLTSSFEFSAISKRREEVLTNLYAMLKPNGILVFNIMKSSEKEVASSLIRTGFKVLSGKKEFVPRDSRLTDSRDAEYFTFVVQKEESKQQANLRKKLQKAQKLET